MKTNYDVMAPFHESSAERDAALAELRREDPVHWDVANQWWIVTRHADVREISRRPELFSSEPRGPWHAFEYHFSMQAMDGERHIRHRNVVSRAFTPRLVAMLTERAERYADEAIDALADRRSADFGSELAVPVPLRIIADMLGVADGDLAQFRKWSDAMIVAGGGHAEGDALEDTQHLMADFLAYLTDAVERRRAQPTDDVLSRIIEAGSTGVLDGAQRLHHLEGDEVRDFALFLLVAGNETTRNGLSGGMQLLIENPEARQRLIDDPSLIPAAIEEMLRLVSPVLSFIRTATRDTEISGVSIKKGQKVLMIYGSANRDAAEFENPDTFDLDRNAQHVAFGIGNHFCMGANLARMELRVALTELLRRIPDMSYATNGPELGASALVRSVTHMYVRFTPERP